MVTAPCLAGTRASFTKWQSQHAEAFFPYVRVGKQCSIQPKLGELSREGRTLTCTLTHETRGREYLVNYHPHQYTVGFEKPPSNQNSGKKLPDKHKCAASCNTERALLTAGKVFMWNYTELRKSSALHVEFLHLPSKQSQFPPSSQAEVQSQHQRTCNQSLLA